MAAATTFHDELIARGYAQVPTPEIGVPGDLWYRIGAPIGQHLVILHGSGAISLKHETYKHYGLYVPHAELKTVTDLRRFLKQIGW